MRPDRFRDYALDAYRAAPGIAAAELWADGTRRPFGIKVSLAGGAQIWQAITAQARPGANPAEPERPEEGEVPDMPAVPTPAGPGPVALALVEQMLAGALVSAGSREIARAYTYSAERQGAANPGVGVHFHSGARVFAPFVHALRPGERAPGREYDLPDAV
ncbi:hypothetical protein GCM10009716_24710 [Streptomyces sodiiphilus]|uniref:Uncharacterized protein n=1 Tax=Streptomyces sodiiphilus TaxID=226217 RepID=A0ABN2P7F2_9ACTN